MKTSVWCFIFLFDGCTCDLLSAASCHCHVHCVLATLYLVMFRHVHTFPRCSFTAFESPSGTILSLVACSYYTDKSERLKKRYPRKKFAGGNVYHYKNKKSMGRELKGPLLFLKAKQENVRRQIRGFIVVCCFIWYCLWMVFLNNRMGSGLDWTG